MLPLAAAAVTVPAAALVLLPTLMNTHGPLYSLGRLVSAGLGRLSYDLNSLVLCCSVDEVWQMLAVRQHEKNIYNASKRVSAMPDPKLVARDCRLPECRLPDCQVPFF